MASSTNSSPPSSPRPLLLREETKEVISKYFKGKDEKVKQAVTEIQKAVVEIYNESKLNGGRAKFAELSSKSWIPLNTKLRWIAYEFNVRGYELESKIEFERVGEAFVNDKINTNFQEVAHITLRKAEKKTP